MPIEPKRYAAVYKKIRTTLEKEQHKLADSQIQPHRLNAILSGLSRKYYELALLEYYLQQNVARFFANLYLCAYSQLNYLVYYAEHQDQIDPSFAIATDMRGIFAATAINQIQLAQLLSEKMTSKFNDSAETEIFYKYSMAFRAILCQHENVEEYICDFNQNRNDQREGAAMLLQALHSHDAQKFKIGMAVFQNEWKQNVLNDRVTEMNAGALCAEQFLSIEALAFARLAQARKIPVATQYNMVPYDILVYTEFTPIHIPRYEGAAAGSDNQRIG